MRLTQFHLSVCVIQAQLKDMPKSMLKVPELSKRDVTDILNQWLTAAGANSLKVYFLSGVEVAVGGGKRGGGGVAEAQSVERATPGEEVPGSIPAVAARSLLVGSVSVLCERLRHKSWSPRSVSCVAARKIVRRSVLGPVHDKA